MDIPEKYLPLLASRAVALIGTIGPHGEPRVTPLWFLWREGHVHFSLVEGRQKLRNLRRDPRISVVVIDPATPTRYVEVRGRIDELRPDVDLEVERAVATKYTGSWQDVEPPGTPRFSTRVLVERVSGQWQDPAVGT